MGGNPISYVDKKGLFLAIPLVCAGGACEAGAAAICAATPGCRKLVKDATKVCAAGVDKLKNWLFNENDSDADGNTNPYGGPVDEPVIIVDPHGNAIPVDKGEQVKGSPNGDYQQVLGPDGKPTGVRLDRGGHKNQSDPRARDPHGHRPGITTPDGNPHLPVYH